MTPFRCVVVDDEELARELIESYIQQLDGLQLVASCSSAMEAHSILKTQTVDLMFLDIEMPLLKGIDFYERLSHKPKVIFTTAYRDYALNGFDLKAVDYLLKPITFARFFQAVEHFREMAPSKGIADTSPRDCPHIYLRENRRQVRISLDSIVYVKGLKDYIQIFTEQGKHITKQRLSGFLQELDGRFLRVHRSYIVNCDKISAVTSHEIEIGQRFVPVGDSYRQALQNLLR